MSAELEVGAEELAVGEVIGTLVERWGFSRHTGRIWTLLYLAQRPLNASQIQGALGLSAGTVSGFLTELSQWHVVKRVRFSNDRNVYYEVETQIWKSMANVLRSRELHILEDAIERLKQAEAALAALRDDQRKRFALKRLERVRSAIELAHTIASYVVEGTPRRLTQTPRFITRLIAL